MRSLLTEKHLTGNKPLTGKVALVTGGSRGIGAAIAQRLAAEGADVAISYHQASEQAQTLIAELHWSGVRAIAYQTDQADTGQVITLVRKVVEDFGRLDILVNNAGIFVAGAVDDKEADIASLDRQFAVNAGSVIAAIRTAAPLMADKGRIITIGSGFSEASPWPAIADYSASKAAVAAYSRGAARDLGVRNITVNVIQPGHINTDMNPESSESAPAEIAKIPLGRYGKPDEIAAAVSFLASDAAAYISGAILDVDGGYGA